MTAAVRYSDIIRAKASPDLVEAAREAARAKGQKPSEYVRQAIRAAVQRDIAALGDDESSDVLAHGGAS
jgi:hypothetical protein